MVRYTAQRQGPGLVFLEHGLLGVEHGLTIMDEHRFKVSEDRMLGRIF